MPEVTLFHPSCSCLLITRRLSPCNCVSKANFTADEPKTADLAQFAQKKTFQMRSCTDDLISWVRLLVSEEVIDIFAGSFIIFQTDHLSRWKSARPKPEYKFPAITCPCYLAKAREFGWQKMRAFFSRISVTFFVYGGGLSCYNFGMLSAFWKQRVIVKNSPRGVKTQLFKAANIHHRLGLEGQAFRVF